MRHRVLVFVSMALYLLSLSLPALRADPSSTEYQPVFLSGFACLFSLMTWSLVLFPLLLL